MKQRPTESERTAARQSVILRQLIVSAVALGIVAVSAWSLLGLRAPYHPTIPVDDVTRGAGPAQWNITGGD
jgi:hypothetical protein